jgi:dihydrolipoamide dehydrogenase
VKRLHDRDVSFHVKSKVVAVSLRKSNVGLIIENNGKEPHIDVQKVLVTVGREPNTKGIGLERLKVKMDKNGYIKTDRKMRTSRKNIFAVGDVIGHPQLAHKASSQGKVAAETICGKKAIYDGSVMPAVAETDPEIATVGLGLTEAREKKLKVIAGRFPFSASGAAHAIGSTDGFVQWVADKRSKRLLGMQAVGPGVGSLLGEASLAIKLGLTADQFASVIHAHPTIPESLMEAAEAVTGKAINIFML